MILRYRQGNKGFTLLEIIFALAILVIGIVGVLSLFPVGLRASKRGGDFTVATILAQQMMEQIKRGGYGYVTDDNNAPNYPPIPWYADEKQSPGDPPFENAFAAPYDRFSFSAIEVVTGISNLNQVTLEIYWVDRASVRSETFITYLANYP